jgi:hypothetical protein
MEKIYSNRIIVFDMDETLGYFVELGMFWDALQNFYMKHKMVNNEMEEKTFHLKNATSSMHFCKVLDLFPEFMRPDIIKIVEYIHSKKNNNNCDKLLIYTNNQGPKSWANLISSYFDYILKKQVFDKVIYAYKVKGKHIELERTTHDKTFDDLIRCSKMNKNTHICFLDDQYHPYMKNDNVYYVNVKPYVYNLKYNEMAERYYDAYHKTFLDDVVHKNEFILDIVSFMNEFRYTVVEKNDKDFNVDKFISQRMMYHLKCFFNEKKRNKTIKKAKKVANHNKRKFAFTRKH